MKCDTSDPDYPKVVNVLFNSFTTYLNTLFKPLRILFDDSSDTFHSLFVCLIWSSIFSLAYLALIYGCTCISYQMSLIVFLLIDSS